MKKLTAQMVHEAYCTATPAAWNKPWPQISQAEEARYTVMADYLNGQIAPQEQERHFCAMLDCDQPVAEDSALCKACRACEELGFHGVDEEVAAWQRGEIPYNGLSQVAQSLAADVGEGELQSAQAEYETDGFHGTDEPCDSAQPPEEPERRHCNRCHSCGERLRKVLDGEEYCGKCATYRRYPSHGWSRASCSEDELIEVYCPPLPEEKAS